MQEGIAPVLALHRAACKRGDLVRAAQLERSLAQYGVSTRCSPMPTARPWLDPMEQQRQIPLPSLRVTPDETLPAAVPAGVRWTWLVPIVVTAILVYFTWRQL